MVFTTLQAYDGCVILTLYERDAWGNVSGGVPEHVEDSLVGTTERVVEEHQEEGE